LNTSAVKRGDWLAICAAAMPDDQIKDQFVEVSGTKVLLKSQWTERMFSEIRNYNAGEDSNLIYHAYSIIESAQTLGD
jgi:hypothetical protein